MRLIDALHHYDALVARVPLSQWREEDPTPVEACECAYVQPGRGRRAKACVHQEPGQVSGRFLKPAYNPKTADPHAVVALKADVDRAIDGLPPLVRKLFHLRYRKGLEMEQVRHMLRRPWADLWRCHDYHLARMERQLGDWFPEARQDRPLVA